MAVAVTLTFLTLLFVALHPSPVTGSSGRSSGPPDPSALPGTQTVRHAFPAGRRSDVPVKPPVQEPSTTRPAAAVVVESTKELSEGPPDPTVISDDFSISTLSSENLSSRPVRSQPTGSRPRTDAASIALSRASATGKAYTKGPYPPVNSTPSNEAFESAGLEPVEAGRPGNRTGRGPQGRTDDWQEAGSVSVPTTLLRREPRVSLATVGNEIAPFRSESLAAVVRGPAPDNADLKPLPGVSQTEEPRLLPLTTTTTTTTSIYTTPSPEIRTTPPPTLKLTSAQTVALTAPSYITTGTTKDSGTDRPSRTTVFKQPVAARTVVPSHTPTTPTPEAITPEGTTTFTSKTSTIVQEAMQTSSKTTSLSPTTATTSESTSTALTTVNTGTTSVTASTLGTVGRGSFDPIYQPGIGQKNRSVSPEHRQQAPTSPPANPTPSPSIISSPNGTRLHWDDLKHTLAAAWDLHVYGSATLFLLLSAGAALGLTLSPGTHCPLRGALALANGLLLLLGVVRAAFFLLDPYGTRHSLPRAAVIALYNLPLPLLVWAQAALALLALRVAGVSVLPPTLERPPLVAVLAVLQCTLLLAADLLSPALSPVVPVTLQVLSLCWGLVVCLGFLCYVFPRVRCPTPPNPGALEEAGRTAWTGSRRTGLMLGRVLAMCALLGAMCCGLHVYATVWL